MIQISVCAWICVPNGCFVLQRGWTTWTTGAVDKRVIGIAPIVMDLLNIHDVCMFMTSTVIATK